MTSTSEQIRLKIATQDLSSLSFCETSVHALKEWIEELPRTNTGEITRNLYIAIKEIDHLKINFLDKLGMLETIRPHLYFVCAALSKHYLKQPLTLPLQAQKVADLCQTLQTHLASGYIGVTVQAIMAAKQSTLSKNKHLTTAAKGIHHAISDLGQTLLRTYQLYLPIEEGLCSQINQLYLLADKNQLLEQSVQDSEVDIDTPQTIEQVYLRLAMMSCIKHNQLRQEDITHIYHELDHWLPLVSMHSNVPEDRHLFILNLTSDSLSVYKTFYKSGYTSNCRYLELESLNKHLLQLSENNDNGNIDERMIKHLILTLGTHTERVFTREKSSENLELSAGVTATHFFCSGEVGFAQLIRKKDEENHTLIDDDEKNLFLKKAKLPAHQRDVWDTAFNTSTNKNISLEDINYQVQKNDGLQKNKEQQIKYKVTIADTSPGGYCLQWQNTVPAQIKTGEIVGLKEEGHHAWSVGVIRWVRTTADKTQVGVELLSPAAATYGARIIHKTGDIESADYLRVLMLPEIKLIRQPATLITPALLFKEQHKIQLTQSGIESVIQLTQCMSSSCTYNQFTFKAISGLTTGLVQRSEPSTKADDGLDSLWHDL